MRYRWLFMLLLVGLLFYPPGTGYAEFINGDLVLVGAFNRCVAATASGTTYACTIGAAPQNQTTYLTGTLYAFRADVANTGAATINFNGLGAKTMKRVAGGIATDLLAGDIAIGQEVVMVYDGTNNIMQIVSQLGNAATTVEVRSIFVPAGNMNVLGACALGTPSVLVTNGPIETSITCTDIDTDSIIFSLIMPNGWNGGTIIVEPSVFYIGTTHNATNVALNFSGQCVRHGDTVAAWAITSGATGTSGSNVQVLLGASAVANRELKVESAPITLSGTCAGGAHVYLHGLISATANTFAPMTEVRILGVKVKYTRTGND
jgi:hypothetical protein